MTQPHSRSNRRRKQSSIGQLNQESVFSGGCAAFLANYNSKSAAKVVFSNKHYNLLPWSISIFLIEKKLMKEEKMKQEEKYMWAIVDGVKEKVGNFRVEPPGLFHGRGEHPKEYIENIRVNYAKDFTNKDVVKRQVAVATYLIDKLALRAGNEKTTLAATIAAMYGGKIHATLKKTAGRQIRGPMAVAPPKMRLWFLPWSSRQLIKIRIGVARHIPARNHEIAVHSSGLNEDFKAESLEPAHGPKARYPKSGQISNPYLESPKRLKCRCLTKSRVLVYSKPNEPLDDGSVKSIQGDYEERKFNEECGVVAVYGDPAASRLCCLGLHAIQHRGQEGAGIVTSHNGKVLKPVKDIGLVSQVFNESELNELPGEVGIGHVRYSTTGTSTRENVQPLRAECKFGAVAVAHNGNLVNYNKLKKMMQQNGCIFEASSDTEVVLHLIALSKETSLIPRIIDACEQLEGAFSMVLLTEDKLVAVCDPRGFRPLVIGRRSNGSVVFASETCAFELMDETRRSHSS
ncbi:hypothetical protein IFM89_037978 [Coptis chinensis]|uniref:Glutamine amidotransferase type-2 domain-containing protein n=1 Tax=Coptis chinensis TaxID=261450 RepID=A0A835I7L1_9MAGN|nr:hypothetical protein IFM89_037978 [Coptis chinensis]